MALKGNINGQVRGFYYAASGNDLFDGQTVERPKSTIQAAIDEVAALNPPPSGGAIGLVTVAQGGIFDQNIVLVDAMEFLGQGASLIDTSNLVTVTVKSINEVILTSVINVPNNGTCVLADGIDLMSFSCAFMEPFGDGSTGIDLKGVCDEVFFDVTRLRISGENATGIKITSTQVTPLDFDIDAVGIEGDNSTFLEYDPVSATDEAVFTVSSVINKNAITTFTGTTAILVKTGQLTVSFGSIESNTAIKVESGAVLEIVGSMMAGDIIVDLGGTLNCNIVTHVGTVTNNGTINGIINGVPFGSYRQKHQEQVVLNASDFTTQNPATTDTLMQITFGAAQFGPSDPVQLSAAGAVTINQSDQYNADVVFQFGRQGAAGSFALVFFRVLINGVQFGDSRSAQLDNPNGALLVQFATPLDLLATQVLTLEFWRDSTGFDAGTLISNNPVLAGANNSPSAAIRLTRNRLVQPI